MPTPDPDTARSVCLSDEEAIIDIDTLSEATRLFVTADDTDMAAE